MIDLRNQFDGCRFISYSYGWWDKKYRVLMLFKHFGLGFTRCNGQYFNG